MLKKGFKDLAQEAINHTSDGLNLLVEIYELQEAIKNLPQKENLEQIIREIAEKEKMAINLIQRATIIQRELMKNQHEAIVNLIKKMS